MSSNTPILNSSCFVVIGVARDGDAAMWSSSIRMSLTFKNDFNVKKYRSHAYRCGDDATTLL
jgi:hypothetical protein